MALDNLTKAPSENKRGPDCKVCVALKELPEKQSAVLLAVLKDPRWRYTRIADELATEPDLPDWVRRIPAFSLGNHARGQCYARTKLRGGDDESR